MEAAAAAACSKEQPPSLADDGCCAPPPPPPADDSLEAQQRRAFGALLRAGALCDVQLQASDGERFAAHRLMLAASSGFFRALFCGAGRAMRGGGSGGGGGGGGRIAGRRRARSVSGSSCCLAADGGGGDTGDDSGDDEDGGGGGGAAAAAGGTAIVALPYAAAQVRELLVMLYEGAPRVCAASVAWLLDAASFLEITALLDAACAFLLGALNPETAVDVALLAHTYAADARCAAVADAAVRFVAQRASALLLLPDARRGLARQWPAALLRQLLASDALEPDQESDLLCLLADWVCAQPGERGAALGELLPQLQLSRLPEEPPLLPQQLAACVSPGAAALAQQLHAAALELHRYGGGDGGRVAAATAAAEAACRRHQQHVQQAFGGGDGAGCSSSGRNPGHWLHSQPTKDGDNDSIWPHQHQHQHQLQPQHSGVDSASTSSSSFDDARMVLDARSGPLRAPDSEAGADAAAAGAAAAAAAVSGAAMAPPLPWPAVDDGGSGGGRGRVGAVVAGGHDPSWRGLRAVELYEPARDAWTAGPPLPLALPFAGAGVLGRDVLAVGGGMYSSTLARLDGAAGSWAVCEGPRTSRLHAAVACCGGRLFVTGGRSAANQVVAVAEAFDPAAAAAAAAAGGAAGGGSSAWSQLPDMALPRYAHAAAPLGGRVFVVGGQATTGGLHASVEAFEPALGAWAAMPGAPLQAERKYCAAAALGGRLVVVGGMGGGRLRLASCEALDPREGAWRRLPNMAHARSSCGVAALGGALYVAGGNAGDERLHRSVEAFDAAAGRWRECAPLACGRSGLLAAAV